MTFAFDLDGTCTKHPLVFQALAGALLEAGHRVVILTAVPGGESARLNRIGLVSAAGMGGKYTDLICVESGEEKGRWCKEHAVDLMVDDTDSYLEAVRKSSPQTALLHVL